MDRVANWHDLRWIVSLTLNWLSMDRVAYLDLTFNGSYRLPLHNLQRILSLSLTWPSRDLVTYLNMTFTRSCRLPWHDLQWIVSLVDITFNGSCSLPWHDLQWIVSLVDITFNGSCSLPWHDLQWIVSLVDITFKGSCRLPWHGLQWPQCEAKCWSLRLRLWPDHSPVCRSRPPLSSAHIWQPDAEESARPHSSVSSHIGVDAAPQEQKRVRKKENCFRHRIEYSILL